MDACELLRRETVKTRQHVHLKRPRFHPRGRTNKLRDYIVIVRLIKCNFAIYLVGGVPWDFVLVFFLAAAQMRLKPTEVVCRHRGTRLSCASFSI